jgi:hypothetical protein
MATSSGDSTHCGGGHSVRGTAGRSTFFVPTATASVQCLSCIKKCTILSKSNHKSQTCAVAMYAGAHATGAPLGPASPRGADRSARAGPAPRHPRCAMACEVPNSGGGGLHARAPGVRSLWPVQPRRGCPRYGLTREVPLEDLGEAVGGVLPVGRKGAQTPRQNSTRRREDQHARCLGLGPALQGAVNLVHLHAGGARVAGHV